MTGDLRQFEQFGLLLSSPFDASLLVRNLLNFWGKKTDG
jgi:hypothetical protein